MHQRSSFSNYLGVSWILLEDGEKKKSMERRRQDEGWEGRQQKENPAGEAGWLGTIRFVEPMGNSEQIFSSQFIHMENENTFGYISVSQSEETTGRF